MNRCMDGIGLVWAMVGSDTRLIADIGL